MNALTLLLPIMPGVIQLVQSAFGHKPGVERMNRVLKALRVFLDEDSKIGLDEEELKQNVQMVFDQMKANGTISGTAASPMRIFIVQGLITPLDELPKL